MEFFDAAVSRSAVEIKIKPQNKHGMSLNANVNENIVVDFAKLS